MEGILYLSIAIGLLINLLSVDLFGVLLGGFVVPGYLAVGITKPLYVGQVFVLAIVTVLIVKALSNIMIIYGRKMLVMSVLIGYLLNWMLYSLDLGFGRGPGTEYFGMIIPGLMAYWMQRQGVIITFALSVIGAIIIRLILVVITGGAVAL